MYTYQNAMSKKHYTKCKRHCKEWINQDCPNIYDTHGLFAIEITFPDYNAYIYDDENWQQLELFLIRNGFSKDRIH